MSDAEQAELIERVRDFLDDEASVREVSMFGGLSFMVNEKMVASALKGGDLLVRVDAERHDELMQAPGAWQAEMGTDRSMGPGWISVSEEAIARDEQLSWWLDVGLEHNRAMTDDQS